MARQSRVGTKSQICCTKHILINLKTWRDKICKFVKKQNTGAVYFFIIFLSGYYFKSVSFLPNCLCLGHCLGNEAIIELGGNGVCTMPHICRPTLWWAPSWPPSSSCSFCDASTTHDYCDCCSFCYDYRGCWDNKWLARRNKAEGFWGNKNG